MYYFSSVGMVMYFKYNMTHSYCNTTYVQAYEFTQNRHFSYKKRDETVSLRLRFKKIISGIFGYFDQGIQISLYIDLYIWRYLRLPRDFKTKTLQLFWASL